MRVLSAAPKAVPLPPMIPTQSAVMFGILIGALRPPRLCYPRATCHGAPAGLRDPAPANLRTTIFGLSEIGFGLCWQLQIRMTTSAAAGLATKLNRRRLNLSFGQGDTLGLPRRRRERTSTFALAISAAEVDHVAADRLRNARWLRLRCRRDRSNQQTTHQDQVV